MIFNQSIIFDEGWVEETNDSKATEEPRLTVTYKNGFKGTPDFTKNRMSGWEVVSAEGVEVQI